MFLAVMVLACAMSVSGFAAGGYTVPADTQAIIEKMQNIDANHNGTYETGDVTRVLEAAAGIVQDDDYTKYDINGDGKVTIKDAKKVFGVVTGTDSAITEAELMKVFNERVNSVKNVYPGFTKTETVDCSSILVTTTNAPLDDLNVTNLEYDQYVKKMVKLMNSFPYNMFLNAEMKKELEKMEDAAIAAYEPQSRRSVVGPTVSNNTEHYDNFPVSNTNWSSRLTLADIDSISYSMKNGRIIISITMGSYSYVGDNCPTTLQKRINTPYGKVYNLPALSEADGSEVNKFSVKNGTIEFAFDYKTADVLKAEYAFEYNSDIKAPKDKENPDNELEMVTNTTAEMKETYVFSRVTQYE